MFMTPDPNSTFTTKFSDPTAIAPQPLPDHEENRLKPFRSLQAGAVGFAVLWVIAGLSASYSLLTGNLGEELAQAQTKVDLEAQFISQIVAKEINTAEHLASALSHEERILTSTEEINGSLQLDKVPADEKTARLTTIPEVNGLNNMLTGIAQDLDLMAVFVLNNQGTCIATNYLPNGVSTLGCLGQNYASRHYFQRAKEYGRGMQFAVGRAVKQPSLFFAAAFYADNHVSGVVVTRLDALHLTESLRNLATITWVSDSAGMVISSSRPVQLFNFMRWENRKPPETWVLNNVYAQETLTDLPLARSKHLPPELNIWQLDNQNIVLANVPIENRQIRVWHALPVDDLLHNQKRYWAFALTVILLGLMLILFGERMIDFHQRRVAGVTALSRLNRSLEEASRKLFTIATTDHLTQLATRGYFFQRLDEEINRAQTDQSPLALLELDIDNFKNINDSFGHPAGDAVIQHMAAICRECVRSNDIIGRIGGEEFAIGLPNCTKSAALEIANKLRKRCADQALTYGNKTIRFTCSIGVTLLSGRNNIQDLLSVVDKALYAAKKAGRNRVHILE